MFFSSLVCLLFLYSCGGGGGGDTPPTPQFYQTVLHTPIQVSDVSKFNKADPAVAHGEGVNFVVWADDRDNFNQLHGEDIWGAIVTSEGRLVKFFPLIKRSGRDILPYVIYDSETRRFVAIWISYSSGIGSSTISAAIVDLNGNIVSQKDLSLSTTFVDDISIKSIPGGFVLAYKSICSGLMGCGTDLIGSKVGVLAITDKDFNIKRSITFTDETSYGVKTEPLKIAFDCDKKDTCFVAYKQEKQILRSDGFHVYGKFININTGEVGQEIRLTDEVYGKRAVSKHLVDVTYGKDRYLVTWIDGDSEQGLISSDLTGKIVISQQNISKDILISDFRSDKRANIRTGLAGVVSYAKTAYSEATNRFYAVWVDSRSGFPLEPDLFYRRINNDGTFYDKDCIKIVRMSSKTPWIAIGSNYIFITFANAGVRREHGLFTSEVFGIVLSSQLL
jgi:hypothetical protein